MKLRVTQPLRIRWTGDDRMQVAQIATVANKLEAGLGRLASRLDAKVGHEKTDEGARLLVNATVEADSDREAIEKLRYWLRRAVSNLSGVTWSSRLVDPAEATVETLDPEPASEESEPAVEPAAPIPHRNNRRRRGKR